MAFKNLEDRFQQTVNSLYFHGSTRDAGLTNNGEPYEEWKPIDGNATETTHDTRSVPLGSTKRDLSRLTKYSKSKRGLIFLGTQEVLQTGNTFSETRIINPLFVVGNAIPFLHLKRPLAVASDFAVKGDSNQESVASADPRIFGAGRLQKETARNVIASATANGGRNGLLNLLSLSSLISTITGVFSITTGGVLGVNERPELDINGDFYSTLLWEGYKKTYGVQSNFASVMANLRIGNFKGAFNALKTGVDQVINGVKTAIGGLEPRASISNDFDGRRYFFEVKGTDYRYLPNSITFTTDGNGHEIPVVQLGYLNKTPYVLSPAITSVNTALSAFNSLASFNGVSTNVNNLKNSVLNLIKSPFKVNLPSLGSFNTPFLTNLQHQFDNLISDNADNSTESHMQFGGLSLHNRYESDERLSFVRTQLAAQKNSQFAYWQQHKSTLGYESSMQILVGQENTIDPTTRRPSYLRDRLNLIDVIDAGDTGVDEDTQSTIDQQGQDLVNVVFYDFVNKKAVPFRAFITGITQTITPEMHDTRYIGRIERNIVYSGVTRELSFQLRVHALSSQELQNVWSKINYLTGLTFPSQYVQGFMVPPFVKITIGSLFKDQPGYIRSLTHTIEDDVSWEVDGVQIPHGILMNISFSIIEKSQVRTGSPFYSIAGN